MQWSYGIITCRERIPYLLGKTVTSLATAGFDMPFVFADMADDTSEFEPDSVWSTLCHSIGCRPTPPYLFRHSPLFAFGNWWMAAVELYIRTPHADRYAIFQDDIEVIPTLREYLESTTRHEMAYWNLCTYPAQITKSSPRGWQQAGSPLGLGAQALVFTNEGLRTLLSRRELIDHPRDKYRGKEAIDGIVKTALGRAGFIEYVHNPTLVNHIGEQSTIGHDSQPPSYGWIEPTDESETDTWLKTKGNLHGQSCN